MLSWLFVHFFESKLKSSKFTTLESLKVMIKMNLKFRAFNCNPSSKKKIWLPKSPISSLRIKMLGESTFFVSRVNGWLLVTPLLEFPFPFPHPGSFWWWDPPPFPGEFFWWFGIRSEIHPLGGSGCFGIQRLELRGTGSSNNDGWSYYFLILSWGDVLQVPTWIFFFGEFERWWTKRRSGTDRPSQGIPFFQHTFFQGPIWLTDFHFWGKFDSAVTVIRDTP